MTRRLTLRPAWPEEAASLPPLSERAAGGTTCVIATRDGGVPRTIGVIRIGPSAAGAMLDVTIVPEARGNGYATEAARAMLELARWSLGLDRVTALPAGDDRAGRRLLHRLGFSEGGGRFAIRLDDAAGRPPMPYRPAAVAMSAPPISAAA